MTSRRSHGGAEGPCRCALDHIGEPEPDDGTRPTDTLCRDLERICDTYGFFVGRSGSGKVPLSEPASSRPPLDAGVIDLRGERTQADVASTAVEVDTHRLAAA